MTAFKELTDAEVKAHRDKIAEKPVKYKVFNAVMERVVTELTHVIAKQNERIKALEAKPSIKFAGVFEGGKSYEPGDTVQHQSALWVCMAPTSGTPSKDFVGWRLLLKKGDAR